MKREKRERQSRIFLITKIKLCFNYSSFYIGLSPKHVQILVPLMFPPQGGAKDCESPSYSWVKRSSSLVAASWIGPPIDVDTKLARGEVLLMWHCHKRNDSRSQHTLCVRGIKGLKQCGLQHDCHQISMGEMKWVAGSRARVVVANWVRLWWKSLCNT